MGRRQSDNGYHLGEHRLFFGKTEPYDTDIRLPFYIAGPGVPQGEIRLHQTTHLDITATVVDLAGAAATAPKDLDGLSFAPALKAGGVTPQAWRPYSFSEFFGGQNTWWNVRVINSTHAFSFHWWCTGTAEVFDLQTDPWQLQNIAYTTDFGRLVQKEFMPVAVSDSSLPCATPERGLALTRCCGRRRSARVRALSATAPRRASPRCRACRSSATRSRTRRTRPSRRCEVAVHLAGRRNASERRQCCLSLC